jgi:hypothetical protein
MRPTIPRSSKFLVALLAVILALLGAVPVAAYNNVNQYHLRLTRLDSLTCGTPIGLQALLTTQGGTPVGGVTVQFSIVKGGPGDVVSPTSAVTNGSGIANTSVTLDCTGGPPHQVMASVAGKASARITLCGSEQSCLREDTNETSTTIVPSKAGGPAVSSRTVGGSADGNAPMPLNRWLSVVR